MNKVETKQTASPEVEFESIIQELRETSHGSSSLRKLRDFFAKRVKKTNRREAFLSDRLVRPPIRWEDEKSRVWTSEGEQEENRFPFLQGDVIETSFALGLGGREDHSTWMVLSPDCDCIRNRFVRLARVHEVKGGGDSPLSDHHLSMALKFGNSNFFPLPRLINDTPEIRGHVTDLGVPFFLDCDDTDRFSAIQIASLTQAGWHILNALIQEGQTRANMAEAMSLRKIG